MSVPTRKTPKARSQNRLRPYPGFNDDSGASAYEIGRDFIIVEFRHDGRYVYTHTTPGRTHVETMKKLALAGRGLATYVNQHVRNDYARKL